MKIQTTWSDSISVVSATIAYTQKDNLIIKNNVPQANLQMKVLSQLSQKWSQDHLETGTRRRLPVSCFLSALSCLSCLCLSSPAFASCLCFSSLVSRLCFSSLVSRLPPLFLAGPALRAAHFSLRERSAATLCEVLPPYCQNLANHIAPQMMKMQLSKSPSKPLVDAVQSPQKSAVPRLEIPVSHQPSETATLNKDLLALSLLSMEQSSVPQENAFDRLYNSQQTAQNSSYLKLSLIKKIQKMQTFSPNLNIRRLDDASGLGQIQTDRNYYSSGRAQDEETRPLIHLKQVSFGGDQNPLATKGRPRSNLSPPHSTSKKQSQLKTHKPS